MNKIIQAIENGKQRGASKNIVIKGVTYWADAAIQKYQGLYQVHVSLIKEDKMVSEEYDIYFSRSFHTIEQAFNCIKSKCPKQNLGHSIN